MKNSSLIKSAQEIQKMKEGCQILASIFAELEELVVPGADAGDLDKWLENAIVQKGCIPAFKNYDSGAATLFPGSMCFSLNEEIVHGIPAAGKIIANTDLVKIDMGLIREGYFADMARTFVMPGASNDAKNLTNVAQMVFEGGIAKIKDGALLSDYAREAENIAKEAGYSVVKGLVGHGIGTELHMAPQVPNYYDRRFEDFTFRSGMTLAIEPMINTGKDEIQEGPDGWTIVTADGSLSAHYENTILVTDDGCEILTRVL